MEEQMSIVSGARKLRKENRDRMTAVKVKISDLQRQLEEMQQNDDHLSAVIGTPPVTTKASSKKRKKHRRETSRRGKGSYITATQREAELSLVEQILQDNVFGPMDLDNLWEEFQRRGGALYGHYPKNAFRSRLIRSPSRVQRNSEGRWAISETETAV
jgi:septal ring factor EnvC (AmiA/AmiB activator)